MRSIWHIFSGLGLFSVLLSVQAESAASRISGRLFTSTDERQRLDADRNLFQEGGAVNGAQTAVEDRPLSVTEYKYNGILVKGDGTREIWVNGARIDAVAQQERSDAYRFQPARNLNTTIVLPSGGEIVLRPGQKYQVREQKVSEGYQSEAGKIAAVPQSPIAGENPESTTTQVKSEAAPTVAAKDQKPVSQGFDEGALSKEISKIRLLEERIQELEKKQDESVTKY